MQHVIRIGIAAAVIAVPLAARAADLPEAPPVYPVVPPPVLVWTGCYAGLNIGGGWAQATLFDPVAIASLGSVSPAGVVGGGQVGCDYQIGAVVVGIQGMADAADIKGSQLQPNNVVSTSVNVPWFETLTARIGIAVQPMTLVYVKGGAAWVRDNITTFVNGASTGSAIFTPNGWTGGIGAEFLFFRNWSVFAEYDYLGFQNSTVTLIPPAGRPGFPINFSHNVQSILVGVNFRFGAPVAPGY
jgi:outer membrane immunogenic protein